MISDRRISRNECSKFDLKTEDFLGMKKLKKSVGRRTTDYIGLELFKLKILASTGCICPGYKLKGF